MKKRLVLLLVTAMAATTVLAGCGSKDSGSSDNGKKSSKEAKIENDDDTLIVGFDASFPPYGYKDDSGEYLIQLQIPLIMKIVMISSYQNFLPLHSCNQFNRFFPYMAASPRI